MPKGKDQKILELEQKIKLLEKQKSFYDKKVFFFDMIIDMAEIEFNIPVRKKGSLFKSRSYVNNIQ